jgi:hypothetical protein
LTYTNNDYGKGLAEAIATAFEAKGGKITISAAHEDGKADYTAEVAALAAAGGDILIVAGYLDQGGVGVIRAALDTGAFSLFELPGGMIGDNLTAALGNSIDGSFGQVAGTDAPGMKILAEKSGFSTFRRSMSRSGSRVGSAGATRSARLNRVGKAPSEAAHKKFRHPREWPTNTNSPDWSPASTSNSASACNMACHSSRVGFSGFGNCA